MNLAKRSIYSLFSIGTSTVINIVIGFISGIIMARLLTPTDFGIFSLATTINALADLRVKFYLGQKFISDQSADSLDTFFTLETILSFFSLIILWICALVALLLGHSVLASCLVILSLFNLMTPLAGAITLSIEKEVVFGQIALISTAVGLTQSFTSLACAVAGLGMWSLLLGQVGNTSLNLILYLRIAPRLPRLRLDYPLAREYMRYGFKYGLVFVTSATILTQFDNLMVGLFGGVTALGFYDRAYRTSLWPALLVSAALARISLPTYAKLQNDPARLAKAFSLVLWTLLTLAMPIALLFLLTATDLVIVLYGEQWLPTVPILQILALFSICRLLFDDLNSIMQATQRPGQLARVTFIQAIVLIILVVFLTWLYGAVGTAVGVGLAFTIPAGFLLHFGHTHLKIKLWPTSGLPLLNNFLMVVAYTALRHFLPLTNFEPVFRLGLEIILILGLYSFISFMTSRQIIKENVGHIMRTVKG